MHFEDLEPHRFEDLVRQLTYDFKPWKRLEPTGRSGSDDGFDARGVEGAEMASNEPDDGNQNDAHTEPLPTTPERVWLIQCKRERAIGPKKLVEYLDSIPSGERAGLYGIIFVAACEFSKVARDKFLDKAREFGVSEAHLWGKGDIEDMLFQPKNDHLLFAYFGISLQLRRRSLQTNVRARLATKRKAIRVLKRGGDVLIRNAMDDRYPWRDHRVKGERLNQGQWLIAGFQEFRHDGLEFMRRRHFAYVGDDGVSWDFADRANDAEARHDPWRNDQEEKQSAGRYVIRTEAYGIWDALPEKNRAYFTVWALLPYESILAIDEDGDDWFPEPHIYTVPFTSIHDLFPRFRHSLKSLGGRAKPEVKTRIKIFPREGDPPRPRNGDGMTVD